jgi:RHS repeat-associated protein
MLADYDALGRLFTLKDWKQSGSNVSTNYYDLAGVLTETSYPNTIRQRFDHSEQNRLSKVTWEQNTGSAMVAKKRFAYQLNATGQRVQVDEDDGAPAVSRTVKYAYDSALTPPVIGMGATDTASGGVNLPFYQRIPKLGRLTQESVIYPNTTAQNADYTYDLVGNRLTRANATAIDTALADQSLMYDTKDRFTQSGAPVSFDANGNSVTSAAGTVTDSYDAENRLVKQTAPNSVTIRMAYDHEGNRVSKQVQTGASSYMNTYYLVDDKNPTGYAQVLFECRDSGATPNASNGTLYLAYAYGQNLISIRNSSATTYYYGYDGQGSVRALFSTTGLIAKTYNYDAWGNWLAPNTEPIDNHYRYNAEQYDIDLGLYYQRARYYSPQHGRFWTMDRYEGTSENPAGQHKYLYCLADPINHSDPSGYFTKAFGDAAHAIIGARYAMEHPGAIVNPTTGVLGPLKPDIFNGPQKRYGEIKPLSFPGITSGFARMRDYDAEYQPLGFQRETTWPRGFDKAVVNNTWIVFFNVEGIVFYTDEIDELVTLAMITNNKTAYAAMRTLATRSIKAAIDYSRYLIVGGKAADGVRLQQQVGVSATIAVMGRL